MLLRFFLPLLLCAIASAQEARLNGTVTDPSGSVLAGVKVTATLIERNTPFEAVTSAEGRYLFPRLPIGAYTVEVRAEGFKAYAQRGVVLTTNGDILLNIGLEVGNVTEQVTITAEASRVSTEAATIQQLVDTRRIVDLPLNGRNVLQLAQLVPGTGPSGANIGGGRSGSQNSTMVNIRVDGTLNVDNAFANILPTPSPDAVQEFTIQTSVPSARYGFASGVIEISTRSGTNDLHGSLYHFFRNQNLDARSFFLPDRTRRKRNQFGFAAGGPVIVPKLYNGRNKTFWFTNFEKNIEPLGAQTTLIVPTPAQIGGDFSSLLAGSAPRMIRDPVNNQPFPNNIIPTNRLDPLAVNYIRTFVPAAQDSQGTYNYQRPTDNDYTQLLARGDQLIGSNHQINGRVFLTRSNQPAGSGNLPAFVNGSQRQDTDLAGFNHTWTISPNKINTARFGFNGFYSDPEYGPTVGLDELRRFGFAPNYYTYTSNWPLMNVQGFFQGSIEQIRITRDFGTWTWSNDFSWIRGRHNIQFGGDGLRTIQNTNNLSRTNGSFTFNGNFSGLALTDFLLGRPSLFRQGSPAPDALRGLHINFYVQDDIRLNRRFTLNLGLRYELPFAPVAINNAAIVYQPGARSETYVNAPPNVLFPGDPAVGRGGRSTNTGNFAPRVGVAWSLTSDQKTTLRAGYGVYINPSWTNIEGQFAILQPFTRIVDIVAPPSTSNPWANWPGGNPHPYTPNANSPFDPEINSLAYGPNFREPMMQQWNLSVQREFVRDWLITAAYVGTRTTRLPYLRDINYPALTPGATVANLNSRRPMYPFFARFNLIESVINANYNSLQATLDRRFRNGFSVLVAYTFSKALTDVNNVLTGGTGGSQNPDDRRPEWGPADHDRTHALVTSWVYQFPGAGLKNAFGRWTIGGWEANGIVSLYSGSPLSITGTVDRALRGHPNRPNRLRDPRLPDDRSRAERIMNWFNRDAYAVQPSGTYGSAPRAEGQLRGPGEATVTLGLVKRFPGLRESHNTQLRGEFFNLLNRPNFNNPGTNIDQPATFGRITGAGPGRIIQLAIKYTF
jgi:hypothetical protein